MFYVRSVEGLSQNLKEVFGTTAPVPRPPPAQTTVFTFIEDTRSMFLNYRISDVKFPGSGTNVSPSVLCKASEYKDGKATGEQVMYKIFFLMQDDDQLEQYRLIYESEVYRHINLSLSWVTRCFVPWHNTFMCKGFNLDVANWPSGEKESFEKDMKKSQHLEPFNELYKFFIAQKGVNTVFTQITRRIEHDDSFFNVLRSEYIYFDPDLLRNVIFQVLFALACMGAMQIQHNDLHLNNILLGKVKTGFLQSSTTNVGYFFKGQRFELPQTYQIRIFDWDHAYVTSLGTNFGLIDEHMKQFGMGYNKFNPRYDIFMFVMSIKTFFEALIKSNEYPDGPVLFVEVLDFCDAVVNKASQQLGLPSAPTRLCNLVNGTCVPFPPNEPAGVLLPEEALKLPYFAKYRREYTQYEFVKPGIVKFLK
jgi:hypothetical protein